MMTKNFINFRPLAEHSGIPFYRTGATDLLSKNDIISLKEQFKIHAYFDFRTASEFDVEAIRQNFCVPDLTYFHAPIDTADDYFFKILNPSPEEYGLFYIRMLPLAIERLTTVISFYMDNSHIQEKTILFGCSGGKDRTGIVAILLLRLLGFPYETILDDYLKSAEYIKSNFDFFLKRFKPTQLSQQEYYEQMQSRRISFEIFWNHLNSTNDLFNKLISNEQFNIFVDHWRYSEVV